MRFAVNPFGRLRLALLTPALGLLLVACQGIELPSDKQQHIVSATAESGGDISPTYATVNDGATISFIVTADAGHELTGVSGCGGSLDGDTYTTGAISESCTVTASFTVPTLTVTKAEVYEGDSGVVALTFSGTLSSQANGDVTVDYTSSDGSATVADGDYSAVSGTLTIHSGTTSNTIAVPVNGDLTSEPSETLSLAFSNISTNALLGIETAVGTIIDDDTGGRLNDTGVVFCGDQANISDSYDAAATHDNELDCVAVGASATEVGVDGEGDLVPAGQDAHFGRDVMHNDDSDGHAGFSYTKIDANGNHLSASASSWDCVLDNVTGLMWEVKNDDMGLRDKSWTYSWYNPDSSINGGEAGIENSGICFDGTNCDTEKFVAQVNSNGGICGYNDWHAPTRKELVSLLNLSVLNAGPTIENGFFPNASSSEYWWTASSSARYEGSAFVVSFADATVTSQAKKNGDGTGNGYYLRLVRSAE